MVGGALKQLKTKQNKTIQKQQKNQQCCVIENCQWIDKAPQCLGKDISS